jgi:hypothetical protein
MAPFQRAFHLAGRNHNSRALLAPTKSGKTYCGAAEAWWFLTDTHPWHEGYGPDSLGFVLCPDHVTGWPEISYVMRQLEPPGVLSPECRYIEGEGYIHRRHKAIQLRSGARLDCKSCTQQLQSLEGPRVYWAWVNEVPKKDHFNALLGRLSYDGGPVWVTTTPIGRPTDWLRAKIEGLPDEGLPPDDPSWWVEHVALSYDNMPHRAPGTIEKQIARTDPWEVNQRIYAQWDGISIGRRLRAFTEGHLYDDSQLPTGSIEWRLGWDWGEGEGRTSGHLVGIHKGRNIRIHREFASTPDEGFSPRAYARQTLRMLDEAGLTIWDISKAAGDTNSAGMLGAGFRFNALMEEALAAELKMTHCPLNIEPAMKRKGAPKASISAINSMMIEGRWHVHESCLKFQRSARHYTGKEEDLKHPLDSARYPVMDLLLLPNLGGETVRLDW